MKVKVHTQIFIAIAGHFEGKKRGVLGGKLSKLLELYFCNVFGNGYNARIAFELSK